MDDFASFPSMEKPIGFSPGSSSSVAAASGADDDVFEDSCSICLECFTSQDPATVTMCNHEYHLQCILDWSQRSKECPICWQLLVLKDPDSQELLAAVEREKNRRSRNRSTSSLVTHIGFHEDLGIGHDVDVSDVDERIMQHIAAAVSRAHYIRRRERQRSSGLGPSRINLSSSPDNPPGVQHSLQSTAEEPESLNMESSNGDLTSDNPICVTVWPQAPTSPCHDDMGYGSTVNRGLFGARVVQSETPANAHHAPRRPSLPEVSSFSESLKSKFSSATARYKESISKGTRGLKEKILARNSSVKELSKGVQREMSAGVARIIERLDLTPKRYEASASASSHDVVTSNTAKDNGSLEEAIMRSLSGNGKEMAGTVSSGAELCDLGHIPGRLEVIPPQDGH